MAGKPTDSSEAVSARGRILKLHFAHTGRTVNCGVVRPFLPTFLDDGLRIRIPTPITVHLDHCSRCREDLEKISALGLDPQGLTELCRFFTAGSRAAPGPPLGEKNRETVIEIASRPESGVATIFRTAQPSPDPNDLYAGFPVKVEVAAGGRIPETSGQPRTVRLMKSIGRSLSRPGAKGLAKVALAAAAVIIAAAAFLIANRPAGALTIDQIYKAIVRAPNVHISTYTPGETEPFQQRWISRPLGIYMSQMGDEFYLWDLRNGVKKSKDPQTGAVTTQQLSDDEIRAIRTKRISGSLGIIPFQDISRVGGEAEWGRVEEKKRQTESTNIDIYRLGWMRAGYDGAMRGAIWRGYIDRKTRLPRKIERYEKMPVDEAFSLVTTQKVQYISVEDITASIRQAGF